jgi:dolichyl-phosphate beta-glucosyltransferase
MSNIYLSIIVPCYNESDKLEKNIRKIIDFINNQTKIINYEVIIVNDGSEDSSEDKIQELSDKFANIKGINYKPNAGKGKAVKEGIKCSLGEWIVFMDADLSTDLSAINKSISLIDSNNLVVIGSRKHKDTNMIKSQKFIRKFIGYTCSFLTNIIIPLNIKDTQCGFKMFNGDLARKAIQKQTLNGFAFDVELLYICKLNGCKIKEFGVIWENDEDSRVSILKSSINFFSDLFKIRKNKKFYKF